MNKTRVRGELITSLSRKLAGLASGKQGVVVCLWGEAGIGKTWTVRTLLKGLPHRSASIHAVHGERVFLQALPGTTSLASWVKRVTDRIMAGEASDTANVVAALTATLSALAPFTLHVEDLHEATPERQAFWYALAESLTRCNGVGFIATSRTEPAGPLESHRLELLSRDDTKVLLEAELGAGLPPEALRWIFARAAGNALFTLEYFRYLSRQGYVWSDGRRWRWREPQAERLPTSVEALLQRQLIAVTDPDAKLLLAAKALLPIDVGAETVAQVVELEHDVLERLRTALVQQGIFRGLGFAHPLYGEVLRTSMDQSLRHHLAERIYRVFRETEVETAAAFVAEAGLSSEEVRAVLREASARALERGDAVRAAAFWAQVADYTPGPQRGLIMYGAAQMVRDVNLPEALRYARDAVRHEPHDLNAVLLLARLLVVTGQGDEAERLLEGLPQALRPTQAWTRELIILRASRHDYEGALTLWRAHPELHALQDAPLLNEVAYALLRLGHHDESWALLKKTQAMLKKTDKEFIESLKVEALHHHYLGEYTLSEACSTRALDLLNSRTHTDGVQARVLSAQRERVFNNRAIARYKLGRYPEAVTDAEAAMTLAAERGDVRYFLELQGNLGCTLIDLAEYERAEELLTESCEALEQFDMSVTLPAMQGNLAYLYLEWNPPYGGTLALKYAHLAVRNAKHMRASAYIVQELFFAAWAEALHGNAHEALRLADELQHEARAQKQEHFVAMGDWLKGLAQEKRGDPEEARRFMQQGVTRMYELDLVSSAQRMELELHRLTNDRDAAMRLVAQFREREARNALAVALRYFPALAQDDTQKIVDASIQLGVLGGFTIHVAQQPTAYRATKGKEFLAFLLEARITGRNDVPQLELQEILYPEMTDAKAASALQQLVYRMRGALGQDVILRTAQGYSLGSVQSDVEDFLKTPEPRLWRGTYLQDLDPLWESEVKGMIYSALHVCVQKHLESHPAEAARLAMILMDHDPYDDAALRLALQAYNHLDDLSALERTYRQGVARFTEVGERLPERWQAYLHETMSETSQADRRRHLP